MSKFLDLTGLTYFWTRIQTILGTKVNRSGDTMTGPLTLSGAPTADLHAATKKYVDDSISNSGGGGGTSDIISDTEPTGQMTGDVWYKIL